MKYVTIKQYVLYEISHGHHIGGKARSFYQIYADMRVANSINTNRSLLYQN